VYASILTHRRNQFHGEIARALEQLHKEDLSGVYEVLAEHFTKSGNHEKAADYLKLASKRAEQTGSLKEAISLSLRRVHLLENMPARDSRPKESLQLRIILALLMIEMNYFKNAEEIVSPIIDSVLRGIDRKRRSQILTVMGSCEFVLRENFSKALEYLEEALQISLEIKDKGTLAAVSYWIGCAYYLNCQLEKAELNMSRSMSINKSANISWRESVLRSLISYTVYYNYGKLKMAFEFSLEAVRIAEESGDIFSKAFAYSCHGISFFGKGNFHEAVRLLEIGREYSEKLDQYWWIPWTNHFLGETYFELGKYRKAADHYETAAGFLEQHGIWPSSAVMSKIGSIRSRVFNNESVGTESLEKYFSVGKAKVYEGSMRRYMAEIRLHAGDELVPEAERWIAEAIDADRRNQMLFELGRDYLVMAETLRRKGKQSEASDSFTKAVHIFMECGADRWVNKIGP
jgi:tetratricopeptide (TPR) repeat protein